MKDHKDKDHTVLHAAGLFPAGLIILLLSLLVRACGKEWKLPAGTTCQTVSSEYSSSASTYTTSSAIIVFSETTVSTVLPTVSEGASSAAASAPATAVPTAVIPMTAVPSTAAPATTAPAAALTTASLTSAAPTTAAPATVTPTAIAPTAIAPTTSSSTAHEHRFSPWAVTSPPSCTTDGTETRTCSACGLFETRPVPAPGHDWHTETVVVCEARIEYVKVLDAWDETITLQDAWTEEVTEMHWFCEGCGMDQTVYAREHDLLDADGRWTDEGLVWDAQHAKEHALRGESDRTYSAPVVVAVIEHPAETAVIRHDEEYAPVVIPEETAEIRKCARCGAEE